MGKSSNQRRAENSARAINLYPPDTSLGWRVIRMVSQAKAAAKLSTGEWREVYDEGGEFWGCQVVANFKVDESLPSRRSSPSITVSEVRLNAEGIERSRTFGLSEEKRVSRSCQTKDGRLPLPPEDAIELAVAKVKQWPHPASRIDDGSGEPVYGDRAVRVYPKPS